MLPTNRKQVGFIIFGAGMNKRAWMELTTAEGYFVLDCGVHAELFVKVAQ